MLTWPCLNWNDRESWTAASPSTGQLTRAELEALRLRLEAMPRHELETFYKATHNACRFCPSSS